MKEKLAQEPSEQEKWNALAREIETLEPARQNIEGPYTVTEDLVKALRRGDVGYAKSICTRDNDKFAGTEKRIKIRKLLIKELFAREKDHPWKWYKD